MYGKEIKLFSLNCITNKSQKKIQKKKLNGNPSGTSVPQRTFFNRINKYQSKFISIIFIYHQNLLHSTDAPLPEYKTQALKKSRFILSHYGMFKGCWDWLILVATFYVAVLVPYNAAFVRTNRLTMPSDVMVEALFIVGNVRHFNIIHFRFSFPLTHLRPA